MWWEVLGLLTWFPLQEAFLTNPMDTVTVEEGQPLTLTCVTSVGNNASLQWLAPSGFTIFLNEHLALKNSKYQLLRHSATQLSITVPRVTLQDEGTYRCLRYSDSVSTKEVTVTVLATPSKPTLDASVVRSPNGEHVVLKCSTERSKPPPQITWLLRDGLEISGETHHAFETDGKKCNSTSMLTVHAYGTDSTAHCIIRHEGLQGRELVTLFRFEDLVAEPETTSDAPEKSSLSSQDLPQQPTSTVSIVDSSGAAEAEEEEKEPATPRLAPAAEANSHSGGLARKKSGILLLTLASFLIFILLVIVQLFLLKLRKAHVAWKRENEILEHTLGSYRSRSNNEDTSSQEKDGQTSHSKQCVNYITRLYSEAKTKRKEKAQRSKLEGKHSLIPESIV